MAEKKHAGSSRVGRLRRPGVAAAALIALVALVGACGDSSSTSDGESAAATSAAQTAAATEAASAAATDASSAPATDATSEPAATEAASSAEAAETPTPGGEATIAVLSGGQSETFNPAVAAGGGDFTRILNVFEPLVFLDEDYGLTPGLATEWSSTPDGKTWTITLRDTTWHDGTPVTADDLIYSLTEMAKPEHFGSLVGSKVDVANLKKIDDLTVEVPLKEPDAQFISYFNPFNFNTLIVKNGATDFAKPIGTGPFMVESFTPGRGAVLKRNPSYWQTGKPYIDTLNITSFADDAAIANALTTGQVDIAEVQPLDARKLASVDGMTVVSTPARTVTEALVMRVDQPPFDDPRVREALKLVLDREAWVETKYFGEGEIANDLPGKGLPLYADGIPQRERDVERAKALLAEAGKSDLKITLTSTDAFGFADSAALYAQQAKDAGITVEIKKVPPASYFDPSLGYLSYDFSSTFLVSPSIPFVYLANMVSTAPYNESHASDAAFDALVASALAATDPAEAETRWAEVQQATFDAGGYMIPAIGPTINAWGERIGGATHTSAAYLGLVGLRDIWVHQ